MRMCLGVSPGPRLFFFMAGFDGRRLRLEMGGPMSSHEPHWIRVSHRIEEDVRSRVEICVDGQRSNAIRAPFCFAAPSGFRDYDAFINRAHNGPGPEVSFALGRIMFYSVEHDPVEASQLTLWFRERISDEDESYRAYGKDSYGHSPVGSPDMTHRHQGYGRSCRGFSAPWRW